MKLSKLEAPHHLAPPLIEEEGSEELLTGSQETMQRIQAGEKVFFINLGRESHLASG